MLSERKKTILQAIVENYIREAEPVGSRKIAKQADIPFSPATIRNEMSDLEEMGYLEQPHASAGRIPSQKGYRYYVDHMMQPQEIKAEELENIRVLFQKHYLEFDQAIRQTAHILSELTHYTVIVLGPEIFQTQLRYLQIIPLEGRKAVAILVTDTGKVENRLVDIPESVSTEQIERLVQMVNERLRGTTIAELQAKLFTEFADAMKRNLTHYEEIQRLISQLLIPKQEDRLILEGKSQILAQPEFRDVDKVRNLLELLDEDEKVIRLFHGKGKGVLVRIGKENNHESIEDCSIVSATYEAGNNAVGTIGILGPVRMDYSRVMGILKIISLEISDVFSRFNKSG
ncbi:MAG: heat-inducible transcription repressor HrcA [Thermicanus sp.]|nr:heat-inducible transcription repressor HrcA [Thermicanus sp.]